MTCVRSRNRRFARAHLIGAGMLLLWPLCIPAMAQAPTPVEQTERVDHTSVEAATVPIATSDSEVSQRAALREPQGAVSDLKQGDEPNGGDGAKAQSRKEWGFGWDDGHPTLQLGAHTQLQFRARVQVDSRGSEAEVGSADAFDLSRRRIGVEGQIGNLFDFQVERELDNTQPWRDVYLNYRHSGELQVQAGKFKQPFSLDENTSAANLDFVYRSRIATQLAPGRDVGVMAHGRALDRLLGYQLGVFTHDGENARPRNDAFVYGNRTIAGRLVVQPVQAKQSVLRDLQLGVAFTTTEVPEGISGLRGRTAMDASFFPADHWVQGARRRVGFELRWRPGPWSVKAEYMRASTERRGQSVDDTDLPDLLATGWYLSGTYLVTGERKANGADAPRRPLFRGGYGALELASRIEHLRFSSGSGDEPPSISPRAEVVLANADRVATFGLNWYPIRGVKVQANVVSETIADPSRGPMPDKARFWSRLIRLQLSM
jgi:phosphate-selective porin OprO and OprP